MLDLESLLESYNELPLAPADYRVRIQGQWAKNSRVLKLQIRTGVTLTVYAKTSGRIRFEVSHDLKAALLRPAGARRASNIRHTFSKTAGVYELIDRQREDAAKTVNDVLAHCRNRRSIPASDKTAVDLLFDIAKAVGHPTNAKMITNILRQKGSISSLSGLGGALLKLKRKGILRTQDRNAKQEYVVTDPCKFALQMLQQHGSFPHLTARKRTRAA